MRILNRIKCWWLFKVLKKPLSTGRVFELTMKECYIDLYHKILNDAGYNIKKKQIDIEFYPIGESEVEHLKKLFEKAD
jgi:hypothetical protein